MQSTDPTMPPPPPPPPPYGVAQPVGLPPQPSPADVQQGKLMAVLSYAINFLCLPFFIVPLVMRDSAFSLYHAKQCLILWIFAIAASIVGVITTPICIGPVITVAAVVFVLVLNIVGLINVSGNLCKPLPLIGVLAESWFSGITPQQSYAPQAPFQPPPPPPGYQAPPTPWPPSSPPPPPSSPSSPPGAAS